MSNIGRPAHQLAICRLHTSLMETFRARLDLPLNFWSLTFMCLQQNIWPPITKTQHLSNFCNRRLNNWLIPLLAPFAKSLRYGCEISRDDNREWHNYVGFPFCCILSHKKIWNYGIFANTAVILSPLSHVWLGRYSEMWNRCDAQSSRLQNQSSTSVSMKGIYGPITLVSSIL